MTDTSAHVLIIDDEEIIREALQALLTMDGCVVRTAATAAEGLALLADEDFDTVLLDLMLPDRSGLDVLDEIRRSDEELPVVMITAFGTIDTAVRATKQGAFHYFTKPFKNDEVLVVLRNAVERRRLLRENLELRNRLKSGSHRFEQIIGGSPKMRAIYDLVGRAAPSRTTVLIQGESGTGKELVAQAVHRNSARADKSFVTVNSGNLPPDLLESLLFGHVKGAFTGAVAMKKGLFEVADRGTIFFDEIGDVPLETQAKLLRVIQAREFMRLGGVDTIKVDVRIIAATNVDLRKSVAEGKFREDLFYRLNVIPVQMPALREHKEDIPLLVQHFLEKHSEDSRKLGWFVTPEALDLLMSYDWPGNVRELENVIERAVMVTSGERITQGDLPVDVLVPPKHLRSDSASSPLAMRPARKSLEGDLIRRALRATGGNRTHAAQLLEISHRALLYKLKEYGITD
jgi:DNA-binding NtrC family response regulator